MVASRHAVPSAGIFRRLQTALLHDPRRARASPLRGGAALGGGGARTATSLDAGLSSDPCPW
eukprot:4064259-Pleurochrysis_carterae.AAC.2